MPGADAPSSKMLLDLLRQAKANITAAQEHWGSIQHLTGDRRNQRRYQELLTLLDAIIRDTETAAKHWARDGSE
jgi:hypothetical protein